MHTYDQLNSLLDEGNLSKKQIRTIELLISALDDWPIGIESLEDYVREVEKKLKGSITLERVENALKKLDISKEAWIGESLTSIKEVIILNNGKDLRLIIGEIGSAPD
jgi:hypothetical protein